jgi:hypothetical protein
MRYLKIALLLLAVTFGTQAGILPVPVGGGGITTTAGAERTG